MPAAHDTSALPAFDLYAAGRWRPARSGATAVATNPATGGPIATVARGGAADIDDAVAGARAAYSAWSTASAFERASVLAVMAVAVTANREALAHVLSLDQGKPLVAEAYGEVDELALYFSMAAEDAKRAGGQLPPSTSATRRVLVQRVPLGVIGVISPWNWPYTMGIELVAPALAAGNAVVWVPAPSTSACCASLMGLLGAVLEREGAPAGLLSFVPGRGAEVGRALTAHADVAGIGFVGSVATGRDVATRSAGKAQILELGGNGPFVILEDADLDAAVAASLDAAFLCAGQSCTAGERWLVHRAVRAEFVDRVETAIKAGVRLGDPLDPTTTMGPLNNEGVAGVTESHVKAAVAGGARVVTGGRRAEGFPTALFFEPTLIDGVTADMAIAREETFGPVIPVLEIGSSAEALALLNTSPFGLTAAVWTADLTRGLQFAEAARVGWVNINDSTNLWESHLPFGGRAGSVSGTGRVGGASPLERFTEPRTITFPLEAL
jgi:acyl-CoA reductase-like NAD-dependent aldehyde dehydrogenase